MTNIHPTGHPRRANAGFRVTPPSIPEVIVYHPSLTIWTIRKFSIHLLPLADTVIQLGKEMSAVPWILDSAYKDFNTGVVQGGAMQSLE